MAIPSNKRESTYFTETHPPGRLRRYARKDSKSCPPSDFRCAFFKGAITTDTAVLLPFRLFRGIAAVAMLPRNDTVYPLSSCRATLAIHFPRRRKRGLSLRGSETTKQTPGRVGFRKAYTILLWSWDILLSLNMTYFFILRHPER